MVFATLSGAFLVYRTLELQNTNFKKEQEKHDIETFNARFFPLFESQRKSAATLEFIYDYLDESGKEKQETLIGRKSFHKAKIVLDSITSFILKRNYVDIYEYNVFKSEYSSAFPPIEPNVLSPWDEERIINDRLQFIEIYQSRYIFSKYSISKDEYEEMKVLNKKDLKQSVLKKIIQYQPSSFNSYLQLTEYLLKYIHKNAPTSSKEYINHVEYLMYPEEREFLQDLSCSKLNELDFIR